MTVGFHRNRLNISQTDSAQPGRLNAPVIRGNPIAVKGAEGKRLMCQPHGTEPQNWGLAVPSLAQASKARRN